MKNSTTDRRKFFKGIAGFGIALAWPNSKVLGANDRIRVGVAGVNSRGRSHLGAFSGKGKWGVSAVCDIDQNVLDKQVVAMSEKQGFKVKGFVDMREMFDNDEIDVFSTATPNHWHSLAGIWAIQAGKHAYVEKPVSHNVWEGRQLVKAARKYGKVCQGGTQSRSMETIQQAVKYVHDGNLGKIQYVKGLCYKPRNSIGLGGNGKIPDRVDYDKWCGPGPLDVPLRRKRFHYDWHWFHAYGNGDMGNQGIHQMDVARWFIGETKLAPLVISTGGRFGYEDDGETANTQIVYQAYENAPLIFETRGLPKASTGGGWGGKDMDSPEEFPGKSGIAVVVQCENGRAYCSSGGQTSVTDNDGKEIKKFDGKAGHSSHFDNFMKAVEADDPSMLNADCEETHYSSALCHTGMISQQLGQALSQGEIKERLKIDPVMLERFDAMAEHLAKNNVKVDDKTITCGPWLKFNPDTEWFEGNEGLDDAANALATRNYREPYVVPEEV